MTTASPVDAARTRVVDLLSAHFAHDRIPVEELDRRLDAAYQAQSLEELEALVRDLPQGPAALMRHSPPAPVVYEEDPIELAGEESERIFAIMSETKRSGLWVVPRRLDVLSIMAETVLDLRHASLAPGVTTIDVGGMMTAVKIIVPPGVRVIDRTFSFMASSRDRSASEQVFDPAAPAIRLEGWLVMAELVVKRG